MEKLLQLLEGDCTLSTKQLAAMTGASEEKVKQEIKEYEDSNVILGYKAIVDWDSVDRDDVTALIEVKVEPQRDDGFDRVAERIYQYEEVEACYLMSGDFDMTVIISGKSLREVALFVSQRLSAIEEVKATATHFILKKYKENHLIFKKPVKQEEGFYFV
jgi:DNA-binding Lrp family transcriptional regulator